MFQLLKFFYGTPLRHRRSYYELENSTLSEERQVILAMIFTLKKRQKKLAVRRLPVFFQRLNPRPLGS